MMAAGLLLAQGFDVGGVLYPAGRPLIGDEVLTANKTNGCPAVLAGDFATVGSFPRDTADACNDVDAYGRHAKLNDFGGTGEVVFRQIQRPEAKLVQSGENLLGVFVDRPDEQVDVAGKAWGAVKGQGVTADDEVFNFVLVEQLEQLFEVVANLHNTHT